MWAGRGGAPAWLHSSRALERIVSLLDRRVASIEISVKNGGIARHEHMFVCSCVTRHHTRCRGILQGFPDTVRAIKCRAGSG